MEEKIINMLETIINMQKEYQEKNDKNIEELKTDMVEVKENIGTLQTDMVEVKENIGTLQTDIEKQKTQRMIDTNNLALVLKQQTKMMKMLEEIYGNTSEVKYVM